MAESGAAKTETAAQRKRRVTADNMAWINKLVVKHGEAETIDIVEAGAAEAVGASSRAETVAQRKRRTTKENIAWLSKIVDKHDTVDTESAATPSDAM